MRHAESIDVLWLSLPFFVAAAILAVNIVLTIRITTRSHSAVESMMDEIDAAGGNTRGLSEARRENFTSLAVWGADAGAVAPSLGGLLAAIALLLHEFRQSSQDDEALILVAIVAVLATFAAGAWVYLAQPESYSADEETSADAERYAEMNPIARAWADSYEACTLFQLTMVLANVAVGLAVIFAG